MFNESMRECLKRAVSFKIVVGRSVLDVNRSSTESDIYSLYLGGLFVARINLDTLCEIEFSHNAKLIDIVEGV